MQNKHIGDVTIDECMQCRGIWFDPGEIDEIKDEISSDLRWMDFELWRKKADFKVEFDPLNCPRCKESALTEVAEQVSGTSIRFCAQCRGNWLSVGDFAKIITALTTQVDNRTVSDYIKESLKQAGELLAAKENPISEWQDLKTVLRLLKYRFFVEHPKLKALLEDLQKTLPL